MIDIKNFILRQILIDDNTSKLSLGNQNFTALKIFLNKAAYDFHQYEIAKTYVLVDEASLRARVWAYITLMNSEIILNEGQRPSETSATSKYEAFPAVKIARLAVDKRLQGNGIGSKFLDWCINHIKLAIMPHVGCRFLVVDAKQDSVTFYKKLGFILLNTESNLVDEHPLMFFDLFGKGESEKSLIERTFGNGQVGTFS